MASLMGSTWRLPEIQDLACRGWRFGKASGSKTSDICVGGNEMSSDSKSPKKWGNGHYV